jgi:hypothetical protein
VSVTAWPDFSRRTPCAVTRRRIYPSWPPPMGRRTIWCVFSSMNTPICVGSPTMVPTSVRGGRSGLGGTGGAGFATVATSGAGGCRDGEKIGRSRVADKSASGTAHSGLPPAGGAGLARRTGSDCSSAGAPAKLAPTPADGPAAGSTAAAIGRPRCHGRNRTNRGLKLLPTRLQV